MDAPPDAASTSDADERELLEAETSDLYWDRVMARDHLNLRPPNTLLSGQGEEMRRCTSLVYRRSARTGGVHSSNSCPGLFASSPPALGPLSQPISEDLTTPCLTCREHPTSPPVSPRLAASPSVSPFLYRHRSPRRAANGNDSMGSPDPLHLLGSPTSHYVVDGHNLYPIDQDAADHTASSIATPDQGRSEVLGESSNSSSHLPREVSPQLANLWHSSSSPPSLAVLPPSAVYMNHDQASAIEDGSSVVGGRYSMRTRQPRQLKPYAFDRLEYKHQLKHHPDAIVKLSGHRSPVESSPPPQSCSGEGDSDGAGENPGGERPPEGVQIYPRRKRKKKDHINTEHSSPPPPTAHLRLSRAHLSTSLATRVTGSSTIADIGRVASIPDLGSDNNPEEAATWYPGAFNDLSSGLGSDDIPLNTHQNDLPVNHTPPPRVKRRRLAPLKLPHLSPLASSSHHLSSPSPSPSKLASPGAISLDPSSDRSPSASGSESTGSSDDVVLLSEESGIMLVDDHESSPSLNPERSPRPFQKRRFRLSRYPVITDFFVRGPREKKKRPRRRGIVPPESTSRQKRTSGKVGASDRRPVDRSKSKARARRRPERPQRPADLSVFTVAGGRILSGWQRRNAVTIDTEDISFRRALDPFAHRARPPPTLPSPGRPRVRRLLPQASRGPIDRTASSSTLRVVHTAPDEVRRCIVVDFDIPFLSSGKVYAESSYLGKGWLYELLSVISGAPLSHSPAAVEVDGHRLSSLSTVLDYTVFLPYACDSFAKVLSDPVAMSHEAFTSWNANMHSVCTLVSWISASAMGNDAHLIRTASLEYTGSLVARIDTALGDSGDRAKSICSTILCLHWFAVELLVRSCWSTVGIDEDLSTAISARLVGMTNRLLQVDMQATLSHIVTNHEVLDDFALYPCVAELWVCLVHLGTVHGRAPGALGESSFPSIVGILQQSLAAAESSAQGGLRACEEIWCTLFGLCSLSQFSAYGVSTSSARMNTSWELVLLALDYIRVVSDPQIDSGLSARSLRRRDAYIRLVVSRCLILHQRWRWRLDDDASATLFRRLVEIFKSRKFADLRGESAGFPGFVQENDPRLLVEHARTDSAFTIFLKLIFASAEQIRPSLREDEYLSRTKKLLSLVTPVGSVQLNAPRTPFDEQLSMLYNRFSSLALAIRILPSAENVLYRVSLARRYVDFGRSAAPTRSVCIHAANFLALQALDMALPVGPALEWTSEIVRVLISEFRVAVAVVAGSITVPRTNDDAREHRTELVQCTQLLLFGLQDISRAATASVGKDTTTALELLQKGCLFPVLAEAELCTIPTIQTLLQGIVVTHLNHALSLQEDGQPQELHPRPKQEESQDEYGQFDLNWDDPMVLAALNNSAEPAAATAPAAMQYTYQSLVEHIKSATASPYIFQNIISAFENQRQQEQQRRTTVGESVS